MNPTIAISRSRVDARRYASGRIVRWMEKAVRSPKSGELEFSGVVESELKYQTKASKRPNGCKVIRGSGNQSREQSAKEEVTNLRKSKRLFFPLSSSPARGGVSSFQKM